MLCQFIPLYVVVVVVFVWREASPPVGGGKIYLQKTNSPSELQVSFFLSFAHVENAGFNSSCNLTVTDEVLSSASLPFVF